MKILLPTARGTLPKGWSQPNDIGKLQEVTRDEILAPLPCLESLESTLQQEEQSDRRLFLLGDSVRSFDHCSCGHDCVKVVPKLGEWLENGDLGDGVEIAPFIKDQIDMCEWLEPASEPALGLADAFGDRPDLAFVGAQNDHDTIGLPEWVRPQDNSLIVTDGHEDQQGIGRWA